MKKPNTNRTVIETYMLGGLYECCYNNSNTGNNGGNGNGNGSGNGNK